MIMKTKPDINSFLDGAIREGGAATPPADLPVMPPPAVIAAATTDGEARKPKMLYLPASVLNDLKKKATELSIAQGRRVTETALVEEAVRNYLYR